jgi:hypothetical protein
MALIEFRWVACLELTRNSKYAGLVAVGGVANHPCRRGATRLGFGSAPAAGVIRGTLRHYQTLEKKKNRRDGSGGACRESPPPLPNPHEN